MMKETEKIIKGSVHKDNLFKIKYALVLMISEETIIWMKGNKYYHSWLVLMNGLQDGTPYA